MQHLLEQIVYAAPIVSLFSTFNRNLSYRSFFPFISAFYRPMCVFALQLAKDLLETKTGSLLIKKSSTLQEMQTFIALSKTAGPCTICIQSTLSYPIYLIKRNLTGMDSFSGFAVSNLEPDSSCPYENLFSP